MQSVMSGAGGGGGGGSFTQKPDTLRSNDTFEGLLGLCAGPIKGPVRGLKSVRVNGTPVEDETGKLNFNDFTTLFADGDPLKFPQIATLKLGAGGSPDNIGTSIRNDPSAGGNPWVTHTLNNTGADAVDLRFIVSQLYRQTSKGIFENSLTLEIQMKPSGTTTWINPFASNGNVLPDYQEQGHNVISSAVGGIIRHLFPEQVYAKIANGNGGSSGGTNLRIKGKTTSAYVHELRVKVPNTGVYANKGWDVRVRLLERESVDPPEGTKEDAKVYEKRTVSWESMAAVYDGKLGDHEDWRGLAWLQVYGKASDNFNGLPTIDGIYDTKIVSVPPSSVYDPEARTFTGATWDGSWAKSFTRDPAWIISDAISDAISGIAAFVPGARLNKWDALDLSKWASQPVPDGNGGTHPRYNFDLYVDQPQKSDEFIKFMAGAVGATAWDNGNGEWRLKVDKPEIPAAIFTSENIEGEFVYSHTDVDTRFNDVTIVFNNEEFDYREDRVRVQNFPDIEKNGRKPTKVVAIGCTNRQQALRLAILRMRTNLNEWRMVNFTTNRQGKILERFEHILIADGKLNKQLDDTERRTTGRIIENKGGSIVVRDPLRLEIGVTYKVHVTVPNPNYNPTPTTQPAHSTWSQPTVTITRIVMNTAVQRGDVTELFLDAPLPVDVAENANIALEATGLPALPKVYRIVDINYGDDGERAAISAIEIDTGKWAASDNATETQLEIEKPVYNIPMPQAHPDGMFRVDTFVGEFSQRRVMVVRWQRPAGRYTTSFNVRYRVNEGPWRLLEETTDTQVEIVNPEAGIYDFEITANDRRGRVSNPLAARTEIEEQLALPPAIGLTNDPIAVAADENGGGMDLSGAVGNIVLTNSLGVITEGVTYSVVSEIDCDVVVDAVTGAYHVADVTADQAQAVLRAVWNGFIIEKTLTVTRQRRGQTGERGPAGPGAKLLKLTSTHQTFVYDASGAVKPQTTTFTATRQNTSAQSYWRFLHPETGAQLIAGDATLVGGTVFATRISDDQITINENEFENVVLNWGLAGFIVEVSFVDGGVTYTDRISVVKLRDGSNALVGYLTNESHQVPADSQGTVQSVTGAYGFFKVFLGTTDVTAGCTFSVVSRSGFTTGANILGSTGEYYVNSTADITTDVATLTVRATHSASGATFDKTFTVSKSKAGAAGATGTGTWTPITTGSVIREGTSFRKTVHNNIFDSQVYSQEKFKQARVSCRPGQTNKHTFFGLNSDPATDADYPGIDYSWYFYSNGTANIWAGGDSVGLQEPYSTNDVFHVEHRGTNILFRKNSTVIHTVPNVSEELELALDSAFYDQGSLLDVTFGSGIQGASGAPVRLTPVVGYDHVLIDGDKITSLATSSGYTACVYSDPFSGPAFVEADVNQLVGHYTMLSLDDAATGSFYSEMEATVHLYTPNGLNTSFVAYRNGVQSPVFTIPGLVKKMRLANDGVRYRLFLDGVEYMANDPFMEGSLPRFYPKWHAYISGSKTTGLNAGSFRPQQLGAENLIRDASFEGGLPTLVHRVDGGNSGFLRHTTGGYHGGAFLRLATVGSHYTAFSSHPFVARQSTITVSAWVRDGTAAGGQSNTALAGWGGGGDPNKVMLFQMGIYDTVDASWMDGTYSTPNPMLQIATNSGWTRLAWTISGLEIGKTYYPAFQANPYGGDRVVDIDAIQFEHGSVASDFKLNREDDVARVLTVAPAQKINYEWTGSSSVQLPKVLLNQMKKGTVEVTPNTTFVFTPSGCTIDTAGLAPGEVALVDVSAENAAILVAATYEGVTRNGTIPITRTQDLPPPSSPPPGGGGGPTAFSGPLYATITDTSWDGSPQEVGTSEIVPNASGQVKLNLNASYDAFKSQSGSLTFKAQKSTDSGASWSDIGVTVIGSPAVGPIGSFEPGEPGSANYSGTVSGLGTALIRIRWIAHRHQGNAASLAVYGTMSGAHP